MAHDAATVEPADPPPNSALQRLVTITAVLSTAGPRGKSSTELIDIVGYRGIDESRRDSLARDIRALRKTGLVISNVAGLGEHAHWVLIPGDSRVRLAFTPEQRAELARAALLANRPAIAAGVSDTVPGDRKADIAIEPVALPVDLDIVMRAVAAKCVLRFQYNGKPRSVDPHSVYPERGEWTVAGFEHDSSQPKVFVVRRITDLTIDAPGTSAATVRPKRPSADPLSWPIDPPLTAVLAFPPRYRQDVEALLGGLAPFDPDPAQKLDAGDDEVLAALAVTNRWIFFARLMELAERVRLMGPPELRAEFAARLQAVLP